MQVRSSLRRIAENGGSIEKKQGPVKERKPTELEQVFTGCCPNGTEAPYIWTMVPFLPYRGFRPGITEKVP
jgi:hypothetical protein